MYSSSTRSRSKIYLIGCYTNEIKGSKLPSKRQALGAFFFNHIDLGLTVRDSARIVVRDVRLFWEKARIPVRAEKHCITKLEDIHDEWRSLKKNSSRKTETQKDNEKKFLESIEDLFDIAHADAFEMISIPEDREFLKAQREKGRRGSLSGVDKILSSKEKRKRERKEGERKRKKREEKEIQQMQETVHFQEDDSNINQNERADSDFLPSRQTSAASSNAPAPKRKKEKAFVTPKLAAALDRTNTSDRSAMYVVSAAAESLGHDLNDLTLSRSSLQRARSKFRKNTANAVAAGYLEDIEGPLTVHWDGKLLPDLTGKKKVERLAVIVSGRGKEQLLGVPKLPGGGTGESQAAAVAELLREWDIAKLVSAMCFDTTSSNTGSKKGACALLQKKLCKEFLYLGCRHHIHEIILSSVFEHCMGSAPSSGPDIAIFKRFQQAWEEIDKSNFQIGVTNEDVNQAVKDIKDQVIAFAFQHLQSKKPREDYLEFLELVVIFLGGVPPRGIRFKFPGALHRARWMSRILYVFKIWMFQSQFKLTRVEQRGIREICVFVCMVYVTSWFSAPHAPGAPNNDLKLVQSLLKYKNINDGAAKVALRKMASHLWYISETLIGFAFFDEGVTTECKRRMVIALRNREGEQNPPPRIKMNLAQISAFSKYEVDKFVTKNTAKFFTIMRLPTDFLDDDPDSWNLRDDYRDALQIIRKVRVVNDLAERGVALIQKFNNSITKNEEEKQFLLQVVQHHRKKFPKSSKPIVKRALLDN